MKKILFALAFFIASTASAVHHDYFVSNTGSSSNTGTLASPWTITCAFAQSCNGTTIGGAGLDDTVWLRGGTYLGSGGFTHNTGNGIPAHPVIYRCYPQETCVLDAQTVPDYDTSSRNAFEVGPNTDYVWFWDLEIAVLTAGPSGSAPLRTALGTGATQTNFGALGSNSNPTTRRGIKFINCYIHDILQIGNFLGESAELYGNVISNVGIDSEQGYVSSFNQTAAGSGYVQYSPVDGANRPKITTSGGTCTTFPFGHAVFSNGAFVIGVVDDGGSCTADPTTCIMPTVTGGSAATCAFTLNASHQVLEFHPVAAGSGYLSLNVARGAGDTTGSGAYGGAITLSAGGITAISLASLNNGISGGYNYCTTATSTDKNCVTVAPTVTVVSGAGNGSGATFTASVTNVSGHFFHGLYMQNTFGANYYRENIIINPFGNGVQIFGSTPRNGMWLEGNIIANAANSARADCSSDFTINGTIFSERTVIKNNYFFGVGSAHLPSGFGGCTGPNGAIRQANFAAINNNYNGSWGDYAIDLGTASVSAAQIPGTVWTGDTMVGVSPTANPSPDFQNTFAGNTYTSATPGADVIACRANRYQPGRGNCVIYAWTNLNASLGTIISNSITRNVDISAIVPSGRTYNIYSAENPTVVAVTGTCSPCTAVSIPMATTDTVAKPVGGLKTPPTTHPVFGAYIVRTPALEHVAGVN